MSTFRNVSLLALLAVSLLSASVLADSPPTISPPANNVGRGPNLPNITLPSGWANPNTGGSGGQVSPPVDLSTGTVIGVEISSGTAHGVEISSGTAKGKGKSK
jgi:hypothetical protein